MKHIIFIIIVMFCLPHISILAQTNEWSKLPAIESYFTTIRFGRYSFSSGFYSNEQYYENTFNLSASFPILEKLRIGTQAMTIAHKVIRKPVDRGYAIGAFAQYNFRASRKLGVYIQTGYLLTNNCSCGDMEFYTSDSLNHFFEFGLGINYPINDRFHLKVGLMNYIPLRAPSDSYNWTQPFIGLKYHFFKNYKTPFRSRFFLPPSKSKSKPFGLYWTDQKKRRWNFGFSSIGSFALQDWSSSVLFRYREFVLAPKINYWINQAVLVGVQGAYYHYNNDIDTISIQNGFGTGLQARFYPLSFKNPTEYRAFRINKSGSWNIAPIVGIELRVANFSWLEPQNTGRQWKYFDVQPYAGFALSYRNWFNLTWQIGPTLGVNDHRIVTPLNGVRVLGIEYNLY